MDDLLDEFIINYEGKQIELIGYVEWMEVGICYDCILFLEQMLIGDDVDNYEERGQY